MFAPGSESHASVAVKYETIARTRAELAEFRANEELKDKAGRRAGGRGRSRLGLGGRAGVGSGALVSVRQAKALGEAADEATELYLEAFFSR